jgi:PAS domain S-box-containing protein
MAQPELILLALDESKTLPRIERALLDVGYTVVLVHDRNKLKEVLKASTPALMLISEIFDGKSGPDMAATGMNSIPTLPVILLAERDPAQTNKSVFDAGLAGYLFPPFRVEDLVSAVEKCLARARIQGNWIRTEVNGKAHSLGAPSITSAAENSRLESILAQIQDSLIILDEARNILFVNQAAEKALGFENVDFTGKSVEELIINPDLLALLDQSEESNVKDHEVTFEDGRIFNVQYKRVPSIGSAITMQDIGYLRGLDHIKNDLLQTVSHDLRSPLTAVLGYVELLDRVGPLNEQQHEFLHRIQGSVRNITTLINDLLDLGRLEAGMDTRRENVELDHILKSSIAHLESLIRKKNIHLQQEIGANLPPLRADPIRIRQMIDNLIANAIKYSPEGGEIHINLMSTDDQIILQVADNGPGIPLEDQARIFEKFYRASNVAKIDRGSGLGLAIVKTIVDGYLGRIWVDSAINQGASFFVVLPAYQQTEKDLKNFK